VSCLCFIMGGGISRACCPWPAARPVCLSDHCATLGCLPRDNALAEQARAEGCHDGVESQGRPQVVQTGEPLCLGDDRSHDIDNSYQANCQQQGAGNPHDDSHPIPPFSGESFQVRPGLTRPGLSWPTTGPGQQTGRGIDSPATSWGSGPKPCRGTRPSSGTQFRRDRSTRRKTHQSTTTLLLSPPLKSMLSFHRHCQAGRADSRFVQKPIERFAPIPYV
jgi:hypothetical protein